ncbi:MAG: acetylneuraminic acid synthetase, partial [Rhodospirillaceae bacterium]|nr:acetylneuraminic acid synthetase [Rhodospirillaceae bacterium]
MLRSKNIAKYLVFESESIIKALEKINANQNRIVFVVSENGELIGSLSDGDFRRWVTNTVDFDVQKNISVVMNKNVRYELVTAEDSEIESMFKDGIEIVPLIDKSRRLMAVAFENQQGFSIGKDTISENSPAYIIAEIGNNHNGDIKLAKQLVDLALESGADCVKFQMRDLQSLFKHGDKDDACADLGAQYTLDLLKK